MFIEFTDGKKCVANGDEAVFPYPSVNWQELSVRQEIINWLDNHGISWSPCGHFANVNIMLSYQGQMYIDVHYDQELPEYCQLSAYLENSDGSMKFPNVRFCYLPLAVAMKNAAHDEPGLWEKWAELF